MNPLEDTTYTEDLLEEYRDKYRDIDPQVSMILDNARREIEHFRSQLAMTPASSPSAAPDMKSAPGPTASHNSGERELASDPALPGAGTVSSPSAVAAEREALDRLMRRVGLKLAQLYHYRGHHCQLDHAKTIADGRIDQAEQMLSWINEEIETAEEATPPASTVSPGARDGELVERLRAGFFLREEAADEIERLTKQLVKSRAALESIAGWRMVNISGEYEHGLRDIIRSITDCAAAALDAEPGAAQGPGMREALEKWKRWAATYKPEENLGISQLLIETDAALAHPVAVEQPTSPAVDGEIIQLQDLPLFWQGRALALRTVTTAYGKSLSTEAEIATYEECISELRAALTSRVSSPVAVEQPTSPAVAWRWKSPAAQPDEWFIALHKPDVEMIDVYSVEPLYAALTSRVSAPVAVEPMKFETVVRAFLDVAPSPALDPATVEACARELEQRYPDHKWVNAYCAAIRALAGSGSSTVRAQVELAWLIEWPASDRMPTRWWHCKDGWMLDADKATWFCRKSDAESFIASHVMVGGVVATEHMFCASNPDSQTLPASEPDVSELADVAEAHFLPIVDGLRKALKQIEHLGEKVSQTGSLTVAIRMGNIAHAALIEANAVPHTNPAPIYCTADGAQWCEERSDGSRCTDCPVPSNNRTSE